MAEIMVLISAWRCADGARWERRSVVHRPPMPAPFLSGVMPLHLTPVLILRFCSKGTDLNLPFRLGASEHPQ